jgi:hypothetical protein
MHERGYIPSDLEPRLCERPRAARRLKCSGAFSSCSRSQGNERSEFSSAAIVGWQTLRFSRAVPVLILYPPQRRPGGIHLPPVAQKFALGDTEHSAFIFPWILGATPRLPLASNHPSARSPCRPSPRSAAGVLLLRPQNETALGASAALQLVSTYQKDIFDAPHDLRFSAAVAYYPPCGFITEDLILPTLILALPCRPVQCIKHGTLRDGAHYDPMSALGQKPTSRLRQWMSFLPPKADRRLDRQVR